MNNSNIPSNQNQPQSAHLDFHTLAPQIIASVAYELMPDRFAVETDVDIRFGNRGSFCVNKQIGAFRDYETGVHGGLLDMICHLEGFEHKRQAVQWLQDKGFLDGTFTHSQRSRPTRKKPSKPTEDMFEVGLKLWDEATPVPYHQFHPVRRWTRHRNLFPGYKAFPTTIRWHEYKHLIIVALASIQDFIDAFPEPIQPRQFHLISIDAQGQKAYTLNGEDKRTYGRSELTCVALFGDPNADEINICEGIADALALFARCPGAVIAPITILSKINRCEPLIQHLTADGRTVTLCGDKDIAGIMAQTLLADTLNQHGGDVFLREGMEKDPAEEASREVRNG